MAKFEVHVDWNGRAVTDEVMKAAMKGLKVSATVAAGNAQQACPELSGTLKRSITVSEGGAVNENTAFTKARISGNKNKPNIEEQVQGEELAYYISANTPYAHYQHENNKANPKFLEKGLQAEAPNVSKRVNRELKNL